MNKGMHVSFWIMVFSGYIIPRVGLLDHMATLFLVFWGTSILFSTVAAPIYIPTNRVGAFPKFYSLLCYSKTLTVSPVLAACTSLHPIVFPPNSFSNLPRLSPYQSLKMFLSIPPTVSISPNSIAESLSSPCPSSIAILDTADYPLRMETLNFPIHKMGIVIISTMSGDRGA